ncbi:MAG: gliding motility-associated C-terminal domain-containing protein [Bacteroidales bacterium]|nr:gliding motility-associated C-terminal domain-containing protein [Bacteroidales bacterium]
MRTRLYKYAFILLIAVWLPSATRGQQIVSVDIDTASCMSDSIHVSIGYNADREVVVRNLLSRLSVGETAFLPDGEPCNGTCFYRSTVTFEGFPDSSHVRTVQDINFIRINIEHSYIGDIYMGIVCPSGQRASLMNWKGTGSSSCTGSVPAAYRSWNSGNNVSSDTYLGNAYDFTSYINDCDSTSSGNEPGTGWNYCWSDNTVNGYSYASGDGIIYRSGHAHGGRIDSSNVAAHTNFYRPNQSFSALVGCPVNGNWSIEVVDAYGGDNGYVFSWEVSLNDELIPAGGVMTQRLVEGDNVTQENDSTYWLHGPTGIDVDTTMGYIVRVLGSSGDTIDSTFSVHWFSAKRTNINDTLCAGDTARWGAMAFLTDTMITEHGTTVDGCDSIVEVRYTFLPTYDTVDTLRYCRWSEFLYEGIDFGGPIDFDSPHMASNGCDSMVHVSLLMIDSAFLPHILLGDDGNSWSSDTVLLGCVPYRIYLRDTTELEAWRTWTVSSGEWAFDTTAAQWDLLLDTARIYSITLKAGSVNGCEDSVTLQDAVWVFENPTAAFDWEIKVPAIHDSRTTFKNLSEPNGLSYLWTINTFGGGQDTTSETNPSYKWGEPNENTAGKYGVQLEAFWLHQGPDTLVKVCADTAWDTVTIVNDFLEFPNLVTPNGDGVNDRWEVVNLVEIGLFPVNELWIYNQWGVRVFHARDIRTHEDFWDPNATDSPDGTYYFRFSALSDYGLVRRNGTIEVLRN